MEVRGYIFNLNLWADLHLKAVIMLQPEGGYWDKAAKQPEPSSGLSTDNLIRLLLV